uniref:Formin binding protein 1a n=1 Tax=Oryzias sinensis TaxID=183150 RepID=A0A8C7XXS7_9TELE
MSCNWGAELWDQFDNLEKHTSWGIDFLERYTKFVKERADIELSYAKQIRSLSKKYHPKRSREDESRSAYTWCLGFAATLQQLSEMAVQREELAENLSSQIACELMRYTQELKAERKTHFQDGRRAQQHMESSWKQLESSKRRFERDCKEAERAQLVSDRIDLDNKTDSEKARQTAQQKHQAADESRKDYVTSLNQFNQDQHQHYHTLVPVIYQRIQDMEERRIERISEAMRLSAEAERKVLPVTSRCLDAMVDAAESIQPRKDTRQVVEVYKSGFDPPGDVEFEDYSTSMRRSISESSYLDNRTEGRRHSRKLWPFLRKNKLLTLLSSPRQPPPPPPTSPSPGGVANSPQSPTPASREPITQRLNDLMSSGSRTRKQCLRSIKRGLSLKLVSSRPVRTSLVFTDSSRNCCCCRLQGSSPADCSHLPAEQRRKKLQTRINNINQEIQREKEQRDALLKMREVYERSPQMGDASSLEPRLEEVKQNLQKLEEELKRNQVSGRLSACTEISPVRLTCVSVNSPDGSYTEDHSAELHFKSRSSEFDDDFDDEEPLPSIGTCKSLYPFQGQNEGTLSMVEGELLSVVEEDKGDGWTRVRRNLEEEGYVPTSYIKVFLETSAKGAMTYI